MAMASEAQEALRTGSKLTADFEEELWGRPARPPVTTVNKLL